MRAEVKVSWALLGCDAGQAGQASWRWQRSDAFIGICLLCQTVWPRQCCPQNKGGLNVSWVSKVETGLLREPHFPHPDNGTLSPTSLQGQVEVLEGPLSSSSSVCPPTVPASAVEPTVTPDQPPSQLQPRRCSGTFLEERRLLE